MLSAFTGDYEAVKVLSGYKLIDKEITLNDFNLWVITNENSFNEAFLAESEDAIRPRFEEEMVLAVKVQTHSNSYTARFLKAETPKNELNLYFSLKRDKHFQAEGSPASLAIFPKNKAVRKVNFYHDNVLVKSVPIVAVY